MLHFIEDATTIPGYFFLKYTPFVPAIKIIDAKREIDESLIHKRACIIVLIATAIFAVAYPFNFGLVYGMILGVPLICWSMKPSWTYDFLTGKIATKRHIFYQKFETILNDPSKSLEDLDLSLLMKNHDVLSNKKLKQIYDKLLKKTSTSYWIDLVKDEDFIHLHVWDFLDRLFLLKLDNNDKRILLSLVKKINTSPSNVACTCQLLAIRYIDNAPTYIDGVLLPKLSLSLTNEEEEILFKLNLKDSVHNELFNAYIKKYYPDDSLAIFLAKHFKYILKNHPLQARLVVFKFALTSKNKNIEYWISEFEKYNSTIDKNINLQFRQVVTEAFQEMPNKDYFHLLFFSSQERAIQHRNVLSFSRLTDQTKSIWTKRALFADAFTREEASS